MPDEDWPLFQVAVVYVSKPKSSSDEVRVSVEQDWPEGSTAARCLVDRRLPWLGPSPRLWRWFARDPGKQDEFRRRYCSELERKADGCEQLRLLAWHAPLTLAYRDGGVESSAAAAMKHHLQQLECRRRWSAGLMIGGHTAPVREEIERRGGLWFGRHKAWMMPDEQTWKHIHSLLPGDF